jgi:3-dehydroquinate dehydratase-2|tara:strand:+ start:231 stop:719 length:489 start_codon:yes stop_codon:yes gene_type:complete
MEFNQLMNNNKLLIINGPGLSDLSNFNEYGYEDLTLKKLQKKCLETCKSLGIDLDFFQTDDQSELSEKLSDGLEGFDALIINPVGYSHSSKLDLDVYNSNIKTSAIKNKPVIEVHIANIFQDGESVSEPVIVAKSDVGFICGLGVNSYELAIRSIHEKLNQN